MARISGRSEWLVVLVVAAAAGLAACGGGSSTPHVASLGHTSGGDSRSSAGSGGGGRVSAAMPKGSPTQLLNEWASCMSSHGDPGQTPPTIDANKVIHIVFPADAPKDPGGLANTNGCERYINAASKELGPGLSSVKLPDQATLDKFSACVRANGIPDFPDLKASGGGLQLNANGGDLSPNNPSLKNAMRTCAQKTGVQGLPGEGTPPAGSIEVGSGGGPGANG